MQKCKWLHLTLIFCFFCLPISGERFHFRTVGILQGLSQASAISIWQDNIGRMWFGNDALNCYNGETTQVYRVSEYFPEIEDSNIHGICGGDSVLYLLAEEYIVGLDLITNQLFFPNIRATHIEVVNNILYYSSLEGDLFRYDKKTNEANCVFDLKEKNIQIYSFLSEKEDVFWLGTSSGLYKVDIKTGQILSGYFENDVVGSLFKDSNENMWVSCRSKNIRIINSNGNISTLVYKKDLQTQFEKDAYCFTEDSKGNIWLGTLNGIYQVVPPLHGAPAQVLNDVFLPEFSIYALYTDKQGTIWIGPYYGEVRCFNPETDNYTLYSSKENEPSYLHGVVLGDIVEDNDGYLYVASEGSGINVISPDRVTIKHITVASHNLPHDKVRSLFYDSQYDRLYIGTYMEGLVYYDRKTDKVYRVNSKTLTTRYQNIIEEIISYRDYLIFLTQDGLFKMDRKTMIISPLFKEKDLAELSSGISRTIYLDDRDVLWISSLNSGLFTVDMKTLKVLSFYGDGLKKESIIPSAVISICGNSREGLYFATLKSGVLSYDVEKDAFTNYREEEGFLLSDICYNVALSMYGNLIVTSNKGVSILNISGRRTIDSSSHIRLDGTSPIMSLSPDCGLYISPRNRDIYIGGLQKLIAFDEKDISTVKSNYTLYISSIQINNTAFSDFSPYSIDDSSKENLVLPFDKNTVNISFASSNYLGSYYTGYEYKMDGLFGLEDWMQTDNKAISFTSLPAGEYTFTVRETTNPEKHVSLSILVKPPFWKSYPAYCLYVILIGGLLWIFIRSSKAKAVLHASLDFEKREAKRVLEENRNRLDFFAGISNEFRTPLTLIITALDGALNNIDSLSKSKLEKIKKQALRMQSLFVELQEFREAENGMLSLKVGYHSLTQLLQEIFETVSDYESTLQITFHYFHPEEDVKVWFDWAQMQKVIYNILFAISKLVHVKGRVDISLQQKSEWIEVMVSCVGDIYDEDMLKQLFDIFENSTNAVNETAELKSLPNNTIGLAFSRKIVSMHKGELIVRTEKERTSFIVRLQTGENHFTTKEKTASTKIPLRQLPMYFDLPEQTTESVSIENIDLGEKRFKILLVDSNDELRFMMNESFASVYEVFEATRAEEAIAIAIQKQPDIIISEVSLVGISGMELCNSLKANVVTLHIPVILITNNPSVKQQNESVRSGADEYLVKPFSMEYLFLRCNSIVKNRAGILQKYTGHVEEEIQGLATNPHDQRFLDKAILVLEKYIEDASFDTHTWSKELGIGRTRLFDRIKHITGMTPNDYLLYIKMNKAMTFLKDYEELTIAEIAYKLGFSNPAYFSKCFKKQVGLTPQQYRKK
ncbi:two-component regulator propeller domain-containing protein [Massilibacteroides sp.]|uniref:two-component regulator propeller domain-containing protein n=1 Tax=Massilibacteroides sp. TaxID=2034766 RepID=UPI0026104DB6|nr:two-component regulator propeller domain-containing protein [Massilibacteroides sp.]MDD4514336.1 helix-turn-helix domain-containing protein [Massilibacteroides sp.]